MDDIAVYDGTRPDSDINTVEPEIGSRNAELLDGISYNGEVLRELGRAGEALTRIELDIACSSEKLVNLNILMMQLAGKENDFEAFTAESNHEFADSVERMLEFDLLSRILDSEVKEMDNCMADIQSDIVNAREIISTSENLGEAFAVLEEKLFDSEESLKQSQDQVSEMTQQSAEFQRTVLSYSEETNWSGEKSADTSQHGQVSNVHAKIKMLTAEQQKRILRMLEKSLARELDLEKKLKDSRLVEDELKSRLQSAEQEVFCVEEEAAGIWEKFFEANNAAEFFEGIAKETIGRFQVSQFNLNGSIKRESELNCQLQRCIKQSKDQEFALQKLESNLLEIHSLILDLMRSLKPNLSEAVNILGSTDSDAVTLKDNMMSFEKQLKEPELITLFSDLNELKTVVENLKEKISEAESGALSADSKCMLLAETNLKLKEELVLVKESGSTSEKVASLERQLRESDIQLQHAVASAEASQEKQSMLYSTIGDMENLIEDLKLKMSKAERRAESTEEKCIILSESNADLNEELNFLRSRMESSETALHHAERKQMETAKGINLRTKIITDLVMQLALERERIYKQISSLTEENNVLIEKLQQSYKGPFVRGQQHDFTSDAASTKENKSVKELATSKVEGDKKARDASGVDSEIGSVESVATLSTMRTIDARTLNLKQILVAFLIILISMTAYMFLQ